MIYFDSTSFLVHLGCGIVIRMIDPFRDALDSCDLDPAHERGFWAHVNRLLGLGCGVGAIIEPESLSGPVDR